jgi:hypothetical protein
MARRKPTNKEEPGKTESILLPWPISISNCIKVDSYVLVQLHIYLLHKKSSSVAFIGIKL